jgi:hypothetical protein
VWPAARRRDPWAPVRGTLVARPKRKEINVLNRTRPRSIGRTRALALTAVLIAALPLHVDARDSAAPGTKELALTSLDGLDARGVQPSVADYRGRRAVRLVEAPKYQGDAMALVKGVDFGDGTIEAEIAGSPVAGAAEGARGFVGIAFHVQADGRLECLYLRPTNGRADDQLRRNHAAQYVSHPDFPWFRLRKEQPGVYESYVDLETGAWTRVKIVVSGTKARLYAHGAEQPVLLVNDLKLGSVRGGVALWIGDGTEAHFSNLVVRP